LYYDSTNKYGYDSPYQAFKPKLQDYCIFQLFSFLSQ